MYHFVVQTYILQVPRNDIHQDWVKYGRFLRGSSILDFNWVFPLDSTRSLKQGCIIIEDFGGFVII